MREWIPIEKVMEVIKLSRDHKWVWGTTKGMNSKYLNLRVDMRDGYCLVFDRNDNEIDVDELKKDGCKLFNK